MTVVIYRKRNIAFGRAVPSNYFILKTVKRIVWRFFVYLRLSTSSTMKVASPVSTAVKLSKSVKVKYIRRHLLSESDETAIRCSYLEDIIFPITSQANLKTFTHNSTLPETMRISGNLLSVIIKNLLHAVCKRFLFFCYFLFPLPFDILFPCSMCKHEIPRLKIILSILHHFWKEDTRNTDSC